MTDYQRATQRMAEANRGQFLGLGSGVESGIWTPTFSGNVTPGTFTYAIQVGAYTRIGDLCVAWGNVAISAIGVAPAGVMRIGGLPFTSRNTANLLGVVTLGSVTSFNYATSSLGLFGYINPNDASIYLRESFDNTFAVDVPATNFTNAGCGIAFAAVYAL